MRRSCDEHRRAALLGETSGESHQQVCHSCQTASNADRDLAAALRSLAAEHPAPATLRAAVLQRAREIDAPALRLPSWRWLLALTVVAAAVFVLLTWRSLAPTSRDRREDTELVAFLSKDHFKYRHRADRAEISNGDPAELERWFAEKLELAISVPKLAGTRPVGARRCNLLGRWAALVFLQTEAREVLSLFVYPPRELEPPGTVDLEVGGLHARLLQTQGLDMAFWQRSGLTYALVGRIPQLHHE
jgi:anti-sigma factor RsiW